MPKVVKTNKQKRKRILVQCRTEVDSSAVSRKSIDGVEHIIVTSKTLPDDIVMNGILYPAEEIKASFHTLERTLAPVEHPKDSAGKLVSATDPVAIHNFYAGAFNQNVRQEGGRISIDKVINVQEALKSERGKRLLDRIQELETNANPRAIHTSTGVFLEEEETDGPQVTADGQEFTRIARNMIFDHDAILLESVAAAQPHQGVGMAVNANGDEVEVQQVTINADIVSVPATDVEDMSHHELHTALIDALNTPPLSADWIEDVFDDRVIYVLQDQFFTVPYSLGNGTVTITGIPLLVERDVTFVPKTNKESGTMKLILNALKEAHVETAGLTDEGLLEAYDTLKADQEPSDPAVDLAAVVVNALKPVTEEMAILKAKFNSTDEAELDRLAEIVGNSDKYMGIDTAAAKLLGAETLTGMAANCGTAFGVPLTVVNGVKGEEPLTMPE